MSHCWLASDMGHGSKERDASVQSPKRRNWNNSWALTGLPGQMSSWVFSVPGSSLWLGSGKCFATQVSEEPLFWCALVVPGGVQTWLCCLPKRVGVLFWHMQNSPGRALCGCCRIQAPGRKTCWKAPSCLAAHLYSASYWEHGEDWVSWFKAFEGMDTPKWVTFPFSFNHSPLCQ